MVEIEQVSILCIADFSAEEARDFVLAANPGRRVSHTRSGTLFIFVLVRENC